MEMLRSLRGDKHEFCLTVIKSKHVHRLKFCLPISCHSDKHIETRFSLIGTMMLSSTLLEEK